MVLINTDCVPRDYLLTGSVANYFWRGEKYVLVY